MYPQFIFFLILTNQQKHAILNLNFFFQNLFKHLTTPYNPCKVLLIFVSDQATTRSLSNPQENRNKQKW